MQFESFDNLEDMMAAITKARISADSKVSKAQSEIKAGDHFLQATEYGFFIFGCVLASDDSFYKTEEGKNYRMCRCYSVACPDGECGDVHVSVISALITKEMFEQFRENNWSTEFTD